MSHAHHTQGNSWPRTLWSVFINVAKAPLLIQGAVCTAVLISAHVLYLPTLVSPEYQSFWKDAIAYRLQADDHKTLDQLYAAYDHQLVQDNAVDFSILASLIPNQEAALSGWLHMSVDAEDGTARLDPAQLVLFTIGFFLVVYFPALLFITTFARNYAWALCKGTQSALRFGQYYESAWWQGLVGQLLTLAFVAALSAADALGTLTSDFERAGFSVLHLTLIFVLLSYFNGLAVRFVHAAISSIMVIYGRDPQKSHWDEVVTVALTAPVLLFLYRNSYLTVASGMVAGLGPVLIVKVLHQLTTRKADVLEVVRVQGDPQGALLRNVTLVLVMTVVGMPFCCCGGSVFTAMSAGERPAEPMKISLAELESGTPLKGTAPWVEMTDGYLFWPEMSKGKLAQMFYGSKTTGTVIFVPMVSRELRDEWMTSYQRDGPEAQYSYAKCRVIVVFSPDELQRQFPDAAAGKIDEQQPYSAAEIRGLAMRLKGLRGESREEFRQQLHLSEEQLWFVENDKYPEDMATLFLAMAIVGGLSLPPLVLRLFTGWPRRAKPMVVTVQPQRERETKPSRHEEIPPVVRPSPAASPPRKPAPQATATPPARRTAAATGTDEKTLIRALLNNIDDFEAGRAYAHLLSQRGDTLGDFVETSILIEQGGKDNPRAAELNDHWAQLLEDDGEKWFRPLGRLGLRPEIGGVFLPLLWMSKVGFINRVEIRQPGIIPDKMDRVVAVCPLLQHLEFAYAGVDVAGLSRQPLMQQIQSLSFYGADMQLEELETLLASKFLSHLKRLSIGWNESLGPEAGQLFADAPLLARLESLELSAVCLCAEGLAALVSSEKCRQLQQLQLSGNYLTQSVEDAQFDASGIQALAASPHLANLRSLNLSRTNLPAQALHHLLSAAFIPQLEELLLESCELSPQAMELLAKAPFHSLKTLNLNSNLITSAGLQTLARSPHLSTLEVLAIQSAELGDAGVGALASSPSLHNLREIDFSYNQIGDVGAEALAASANLRHLKKLDLSNNNCRAATARAIASSPHLANLTNLKLADNRIGSKGAWAFVRSRFLNNLMELSVSESDIGYDAAEALCEEFGDDVVRLS